MCRPTGFERVVWGLFLLLALSCAGEPITTQTVVRFGDSFTLNVPEGAMIHVVAHRDGERQHEPGHDLGTFPYEPDIKVIMNASGNDGSRRFTVFAELLDSAGNRVSWARVRSGFVQGEISELRIDFASQCADPSDQAMQPDDYDSLLVCGSHDTCVTNAGGGDGVCSSACYEPETYNEVLGDIVSAPVQCPERDNLLVERLEPGRNYTCALSASEAFCWGNIGRETAQQRWRRPSRIMNLNHRTTLGEGDTIQDVRASQWIVCALTTEGEARCGGSDGPEAGTQRFHAGVSIVGSEPCCTIAAPGLPAVRAVEGHNNYMCMATEEDGSVLCSGDVPGDQDSMVFRPYIVDGEPARGFATLSGGPQTIGGFGDDGVFRWLAAAGPINPTTPTPRREDVVDISSAWHSLCMITSDGALHCWGEDAFEVTIEEQPRVYDGLWKRIALAEYFDTDAPERTEFSPHRCAIAMEGSLWCWGNQDDGKLGGSFSSPRTFEQRFQVGGATDWIDVAAGARHTCGVREGGQVYCWGTNSVGQLGVITESANIVRVPVPGW